MDKADVTKAKDKSVKDGKRFLQEAFSLEQKLLQIKLQLAGQSVTHAGTLGAVTEYHFINVLRKYLPKRYAIDTSIVIDSNGETSDQIDVIIYDKQYTPALLDQEQHRFVPAEAVYAVFEVKPTINKEYLGYAGEKAESVRKLKRTSIEIVQAGRVGPPRKLFPIVAGIIASNIDWSDGFASKAFMDNYKALKKNRSLDCGFAVSGCYFDTYNGKINIQFSEHALVYFLFRLLQKLQSLGTVPAIDWNAYAAAFMR
jgi:hypothetical protein